LTIILHNKNTAQWYVEPFAGGMNTICEVDGNRIANDINYYLIQMWNELIAGWVPNKITKDEYNIINHNKNKYPPHLVGWV
jgi:DNA adenine methylase